MATQDTTKTKKPASKTTTTAKTAAKKPAAKASTAKKPVAKTTAKKPATKAPAKTSAKTPAKAPAKKTPAKAPAKKAPAKKPASKAPAKKETVIATKEQKGFSINKGNEHDNLLDLLSAPNTDKPTNKVNEKKPSSAKKQTTTKTKTTTAKKTVERPKHKPKTFTKEEKVIYKSLEDAFNYVANLTMVIEERTLDTMQVPDLTLGEIHVLEVVNQQSTMPMTKVANQLKITVGSLTTCVNRLVKKEYLIRERDDVDHRIIKVSTTPKAKKVLKVHDEFHQEILLGVLDGVTIRDANKVMSQFKRTLENYINPKEKNYDKPIINKKK